jgi:dipeptidyl aminopeptidase/acylaminoacyl peptidase
MNGRVSAMRVCVVWGTLVAAGCAKAAAREAVVEVMAQMAAVDYYQEVAISPDGRRVAWVRRIARGADDASPGSAVFLAAAVGRSAPRRITALLAEGNASDASQEKDVAWSRDGTGLAFLSDAESPGHMQLFITRNGNAVSRLTDLEGYIASPQWSPDGRRIAFLYTEDAERATGPTEAATLDSGVIGSHISEQRLATVDVSTGHVTELSPEDMYVYQYDWSPTGMRLVATAAHGSGDNNWYVAELVVVDATSGKTHSLFKSDVQIAVPRWAPDGQSIAFIAGLNSDEGVASGDVYRVSADGGGCRNLTPNLKASAYWLTWLPGSKRILFAEAINGGSGIAQVAIDGNVRQLWTGSMWLAGPSGYARAFSIARDGMITAIIRKSFDSPPQIAIGRIGAWRPVTPVHPPHNRLWGRAISVTWLSDSLKIQGWLLYPQDFDPQRKYPLIVWVHGGPAWLSAPDWPAGPFFPDALLATQGYFVFYPNPRGSAGFGETFKRANLKDLGGGDLRDILAGIRQVVATLPIDLRRIGIGGWSYGGDMTMWALTQTDQFRAAFAGAGTADLLSYYGENDFNAWLLPYFGASIYDDPHVYAKSSPINFIKNVRTPALLAVGDSDIESPALQSREYWNALKTLGVKTELVVYPHEGHSIRDPEHVRDLMNRIVFWFDNNMPGERAH